MIPVPQDLTRLLLLPLVPPPQCAQATCASALSTVMSHCFQPQDLSVCCPLCYCPLCPLVVHHCIHFISLSVTLLFEGREFICFHVSYESLSWEYELHRAGQSLFVLLTRILRSIISRMLRSSLQYSEYSIDSPKSVDNFQKMKGLS